MKKVLFVQTTLEPPGGASMVAAWMIEALKKDNSVSILTWTPPNFEEINRFYGTSLNGSEIDIHYVNPVLRGIINLDPYPGTFQRTAYLMRLCRRVGKDYDVILTADSEIDFGRRGIQYVHYPYMHAKGLSITDAAWHRKLAGVFDGSYRPWMFVSGFSYDRMRDNLTLVNSNWTGDKVKEFYGMRTITVYPPVPDDFPDVSWEEKEDGFVCVGRFHPAKRLEEVIEILSYVRTSTPKLHLHIIGSQAIEPEGREYYKRLKGLARQNDSWISLHENLPRRELMSLVSRQKYGIHAHRDEHFGIAVAEMLKAGCIPFVPNGGGQTEIVGGDERLVYRTEKEAVEKVIRVITNPGEQTSIRSYLDSRRELFSTEKFMTRIREIVRQFQGAASEGQRISAR